MTDFVNLAVIMCVWQRPELLDGTIRMLEAQRDRGFYFILVNNNPDLEWAVSAAIKKSTLKASVVYNRSNQGAFGRVRTAHKITRCGAEYTHYLIIDDDYLFPSDFIENAKDCARLDAVVGEIVHTFRKTYWDKKHVKIGEKGSIVNGSGMILPAAVLKDERILEIPKKYVNADDLWISYFANHVLGIDLIRGEISGCSRVKDDKDSWKALKDEKAAFLESLRATGWDV